jgi:MFS family permease
VPAQLHSKGCDRMSGAVSQQTAYGRPRRQSSRQLLVYPGTAARITYLSITVLCTVMLYYELYVGGSVSTLLLSNLNVSFSFYVITLAVGNLIGAFGSLLAGLADRWGRATLVVGGLFVTGYMTAFVLPTANTKWWFTGESFAVGLVEGICLVATPALIRDFSPQVGRATAMGFWTSGPVLGSLIVSVVGSNTIPDVVPNTRFWTHEYYICGAAGMVVFLIAFIGLRELSPALRDQLMVTTRDRVLIEAKAKGLSESDIAAALRHPFRQLMKADVVVSAVAVSVMLLIYYTAVGFSLIYLTSMFGFSVKNANGLGNWNWGFNAIGVIVVGLISDRFRVRKPFMVIGGIAGAAMIVVYLEQAGRHPGYYTLAIMLAILAFALGVAYTPWMASFTETVEARNPALTATGLAIWGLILRIVVAISFFVIPVVINTVTPVVNYGTTINTYLTTYASELKFAQTHPQIVALAQKDSAQIALAQKFKPELTVIQNNPALFTKLATYPNPASIPPKLVNQAIAAAGGGTTGLSILDTISANQSAITSVIAVAPELQQLAPYSSQLTALSKMPPNVVPYLKAHGPAVQNALAAAPAQWKRWYWVCFGGIIFFLLSIPLLRGRWRPRDARRDEARHEAMVQAELEKMMS